MLKSTCTSVILPALLLIANLTGAVKVFAQKLPNTQQEAVRAPGKVKVDGNTNEWASGYAAHNRATGIDYILANNKGNLYFIVHATDKDNIGKILSGGITLQIKSSDKTQKSVSITFPLIERMAKSSILTMMKNLDVNQDSMLNEVNQKLAAESKDIVIEGISQISDSTISVYNEYGIKAASKADANRAWSCELQLPLKYINHLVANNSFDYKVVVNGVQIPKTENQVVMVVGVSSRSSGNGVAVSDASAFSAFSPTYFSARYTLAEK